MLHWRSVSALRYWGRARLFLFAAASWGPQARPFGWWHSSTSSSKLSLERIIRVCIEDPCLLFAAEVELASSCSRRLSEDYRPVRLDNDIHRQVAHSFLLFIRTNHATANAPQSIYLRNAVVFFGPLTAVHKLQWILVRLDSTVSATTLK